MSAAREPGRRTFGRPVNFKRGVVDLSHGSGGRAMAQLIEELFARSFANPWLDQGNDQACLELPPGRGAMSTDSYVISPLFFPGGNRGAILEALSYAIRNGEGIVKVVGEVGSGKTMLCRMLEIELPKNIEIVYLANPRLSPDNILHAIAFELKLPVTDNDNRLVVMQSLQNYLLERHAENKQVVVFVEEAQSMPLATLEEIRLLSNLETNQYKLLQIVLFGQPELDEMLAKPQIRQLRERITYHFNLEPLRHNEIRDYLNARLRSCGFRGGTLFTNSAIGLIARYSQGLLRRVNILADKALLASYADNSRRVGRRQVMAAVRDSEFHPAWIHYLLPVALATLLVAAVALFAYQFVNGGWYDWRWPLKNGAPIAAEAESNADSSAIEPLAPAPEAPATSAWQAPLMDISGIEPVAPAPEEPATLDRQAPLMDSQPLDNGYDWASGGGEWIQAKADPAGVSRQHDETGVETGTPTMEFNRPITEENATMSMREAYLHKLPPEEVWMDAPATRGTTCNRCIAIIYRPLQRTEKM